MKRMLERKTADNSLQCQHLTGIHRKKDSHS